MTGTTETQALELTELTRLFEEIRRYLDAVDVFRREGHEPRWRLECPDPEVSR